MNARSVEPHWLPIVQQCEAQGGTIAGLPSMADVFGQGHWNIDIGRLRPDGLVLRIMYWQVPNRGGSTISHRVGSFYLRAEDMVRRPKEQTGKIGALFLGYDECGRKLIRVNVGKQNSAEFNVMAVIWEEHRGVKLPRPVPYVGSAP